MLTLRRTLAAAALAVGAATGLAVALPQDALAQGATPDTRPTVAVIDFTNGAIGKLNADMEPLRAGIAGMLITELGTNASIRVVEREQLRAVMNELQLGQSREVDTQTAVRIGKLLNAHHIVTGGFITDPKGRMIVTARSIETETGRIEYTTKVNGKSDDVLELVEKLSGDVNKGLKLPALTIRTGSIGTPGTPGGTSGAGSARLPAAKKQPVPLPVVMLYSRALQARDRNNKDEAVQLLRASLDKFPNYEAAKQELARLEGPAAAKPGA
jgi:TolB-like protein